MTAKWSYQDYILKQPKFIERHKEHNQRYVDHIRESDRRLIRIMTDLPEANMGGARRQARVLDVGCNTGNLLLHLRDAHPSMELVGIDISEEMIALCKNNTTLRGISFEALNIIESRPKTQFDFVVLNAVSFSWDDEGFSRALENLSCVLKEGGWLIAFDLFTPFKQDLTVVERSELYPSGVSLYLRSYESLERLLIEKSFSNISFSPFYLSVDLKLPAGDFGVTRTHTVRTNDGKGLSFRGALFQPWCHLVGQKTG